jgi:hypothetical protein
VYAQALSICFHARSSSTTNLQHRTLAQQLSATFLNSGNLLRQHAKEPLIARYTSKSAYYTLQE